MTPQTLLDTIDSTFNVLIVDKVTSNHNCVSRDACAPLCHGTPVRLCFTGRLRACVSRDACAPVRLCQHLLDVTPVCWQRLPCCAISCHRATRLMLSKHRNWPLIHILHLLLLRQRLTFHSHAALWACLTSCRMRQGSMCLLQTCLILKP